jgi:hypothetical protein
MHDSSQFRRTILALTAGVNLLLIFSGCDKTGGREVLGNVLSLRGTVTLDSGKKNARDPQTVTTASKLSVGDRLETSPNAMIAVSLIPGIFVEVGAETEVVIAELRVRKRGDAMVDAMTSRLATLHLNHGVIYASLPSVGSGRCELNVQTDLGTLVAQGGALVSVRLTSETVRVMCVDGEVKWSRATDGRMDEIPPGYFQDYRRNDVPDGNLTPELAPVSENAGAQSDVAATLETAAAFDDFAMRVRNASPPKSSHPITPPPVQPP